MTAQMTLDWSRAAGDIAMRRAASHAERAMPGFAARAASYMAAYLTANGPTSGEDLVDAAIAAGFAAADARAFGRAFRLLREQHGAPILRSDLPRRRGHGTSGGRLYGRPQG